MDRDSFEPFAARERNPRFRWELVVLLILVILFAIGMLIPAGMI